ncbi:MAG: SGNH/GDSL hydrolase family protein [Mucilaginibacter sp.]
MKLKIAFILLSLLFASSFLAKAQNLDFEQGLTGWMTTGKVSIDTSNYHAGARCIKIGEGIGSIFKRLPVSSLAIVQFNAYLKSSAKGVKGYSFIRFFNSRHKNLLEYKSNEIDSLTYQQTGNYTETPANAVYMEIGIAKNSPGLGYIYADDFTIESDVTKHKGYHQPMVDLDQYMRPFWHSDTIFNETILLYAANGKPADGKLLYQPDHILSVKSFDLRTIYTSGKDYTQHGNVIERTANSAMPYRADTSFDTKKDLAWFNTQSQWVVVTYTHHDKWTGPVPAYKGAHLTNTMAKLRAKKPLRIAAFGMSITRGMNISSYDDVPPYMPNYIDLLARQLRKAYHYQGIKMYNAGLPGAIVEWGAEFAPQYINPLKPDLVIIDFGMNDFWRFTPEGFKGYILTIVAKIHAKNPKVEFLLLSNMKFDPAYMLDSDQYKSFYQGNLEGYSKVLKQLEARGVATVDMYEISDAVYQRKKAKDCISNPLHPNDYLERWYAQALSAALINSKEYK